jgi:hypothetical protein
MIQPRPDLSDVYLLGEFTVPRGWAVNWKQEPHDWPVCGVVIEEPDPVVSQVPESEITVAFLALVLFTVAWARKFN